MKKNLNKLKELKAFLLRLEDGFTDQAIRDKIKEVKQEIKKLE